MKARSNSKKEPQRIQLHASTVAQSLEASPRFQQIQQHVLSLHPNKQSQTRSRQVPQKSQSKPRLTNQTITSSINDNSQQQVYQQPIRAIHIDKNQQLTKKEHAIAAVNPVARKRLMEAFTQQNNQKQAQGTTQTRKLTIKANQVKFLSGQQNNAIKSVQHQQKHGDDYLNSNNSFKQFKFAEQAGLSTPPHGKRPDESELVARGSTQLASFSGSIHSSIDQRKQGSVKVKQKGGAAHAQNASHGPSHSSGAIIRKQPEAGAVSHERHGSSFTDLQKQSAPPKSPTVTNSGRASRKLQGGSMIVNQSANSKRQSFVQKNNTTSSRVADANAVKARRTSYHERNQEPHTRSNVQRPYSAVKRTTDQGNRAPEKPAGRKSAQRSPNLFKQGSVILAPSASEVRGGRVSSKKAEQPSKDAGGEVISTHEQSMEQLTNLRVANGVIKGRLDLHADLSGAQAKIHGAKQNLEIDFSLGLSVTIDNGDMRPDVKVASPRNPRPKCGSPGPSRGRTDMEEDHEPQQINTTNNEIDRTQLDETVNQDSMMPSQSQMAKRQDADEDMNIATIDLDPPPIHNSAFGAGDSPNVLKKSSHKNMMIKQNHFMSLSRREAEDISTRRDAAVPIKADPNLRFGMHDHEDTDLPSATRTGAHQGSINRANEMSVGRAPSAAAEVRGSQSLSRTGNRSRLPSRKRYQMDQRSTQTKLVVAKKDIKYLTVNMLNKNLIEIDLSGNKIGSLPDELCTLSCLETLDLSSNSLVQLPAHFGQLTSLKDLNLAQNNLTSLPASVAQCRSLKTLHVNENKIERLPARLGDLSRLQYLSLHGNLLAEIPASFASLVNLSAMSLEWFNYLKPTQDTVQNSGHQNSALIIRNLRDFCGATISIKNEAGLSSGPQLSFCEFLLYFHVCRELKRTELHSWEVVERVNALRFGVKDRCISQHLCSNRHAHLLQDVVRTKCASSISRLINANLDLNILDAAEQAPLLGALRQQSSEFARIMLSSTSSVELDLNRQSLKHGYPLHMAILSHKFEVALELLAMDDRLDPHVLNTVGANVVHLLFVKYEKNPKTAFEILRKCQQIGVKLNLVDRMQAAPLHLALGKKQIQAIRDMSKMNSELGRPAFDFNILDKRGMTPLHYAVEKQDHDLFLALISDPYIDVNKVDTEELNKARRSSVIFSAFQKILYCKEKLCMKKKFYYEESRVADQVRQVEQDKGRQAPALPQQPLFSATNKTKKHIDFGFSEIEDIVEPYSKYKGSARDQSMQTKRKQQRSFIAPQRPPILNSSKSTFVQSSDVSRCKNINQLRKILFRQDGSSMDLNGSFSSSCVNDLPFRDDESMVEHCAYNIRTLRQAQKDECASNIGDGEWQGGRQRDDQSDHSRAIELFQKELVKKAVAHENPYLQRGGSRPKPITAWHNSKQGISMGNMKEGRSLSIMSRMSIKSDMPATKLIQSRPHVNPGASSSKRRIQADTDNQFQYFTSSEAQKVPSLHSYMNHNVSHSNQKSITNASAAVPNNSRGIGKPLLSPQHMAGSQIHAGMSNRNKLNQHAKPPVDLGQMAGRKFKPNSFDIDAGVNNNNDIDDSSALDDDDQELSSNLQNLDQLSQINLFPGDTKDSGSRSRDAAISEYQVNRIPGPSDKPLDLTKDKRSVLSATTPLNLQNVKPQDGRSLGVSSRSPLQLSQYVPKPSAGQATAQPALDLSNSHSGESNGWARNDDDRQHSIEKNYFSIIQPTPNVIPAAAVQGRVERAQSSRVQAPAAIPAAAVPVSMPAAGGSSRQSQTQAHSRTATARRGIAL